MGGAFRPIIDTTDKAQPARDGLAPPPADRRCARVPFTWADLHRPGVWLCTERAHSLEVAVVCALVTGVLRT